MCELELPGQEAREDHLDAKHPKCEECDDRFIDHDAENRHYETYHAPAEHPIICLICKKRFWRFDDLNRHQAEHRREHPRALSTHLRGIRPAHRGTPQRAPRRPDERAARCRDRR